MNWYKQNGKGRSDRKRSKEIVHSRVVDPQRVRKTIAYSFSLKHTEQGRTAK